MQNHYTMMINLKNKPCVVVGGGLVAERKINSLLSAGAKITVISPLFTTTIQQWVDIGDICGKQREYTSNDIEGAFLIIAATNKEKVNLKVAQDAHTNNQLINIVDQPELSSFISPAAFTRGRLHVSVTTLGASPALAKKIKQKLEAEYGEEYEIYLQFLHEYRMAVKNSIQDVKERQKIYQELLEQDALQCIRDGKFESYKNHMLSKFGGLK